MFTPEDAVEKWLRSYEDAIEARHTPAQGLKSRTSLFTEILAQLASYSVFADTGEATRDNLIELEALGQRIRRAEDQHRFTQEQYTALINAYADILTNYNMILGINAPAPADYLL